VEFGVLAWMKRSPWLGLAAMPLLLVAGFAARRAVAQRRQR
jgi:hypothetical protein